MPASKKILITGAGGFIGRHLCQYFTSQNQQVIACLGHEDQSSYVKATKRKVIRLPDPLLKELLEEEQPDYVLHCAGGASVAESFKNPEKDFEQNVVTTNFLLETLRKCSAPLPKLVFFSSAAVYGNPTTLPISNATKANPISPYGLHKLMSELQCEIYHRIYGMPVTILRIFSVYGPGLKKQILWDIYQKSLKNQSISLYGTGDETRDLMYISDLSQVVGKVLDQSLFNGNIINVGTGTTVTIKHLADTLLEAMNTSSSFQFTGEVKQGDPSFWSMQCAMPLDNWMPLKVGIKKYVDWAAQELRQ